MLRPGKLRFSAKGKYIYSLLDIAALATTAQIDLSDAANAPDFTAVSFYKIFGFPDIGGLIVRKDSGHILQWRHYFGGGTVDMVTCVKDSWVMRKDYTTDNHYELHDQLEDGTLPFHAIIALGHAIKVHRRLFTSMSHISAHTSLLGKRLYDGLVRMRYPTGRPLCIVHNEPNPAYGDSSKQGSTVSLSVLRHDGSYIPYTDVERLANANNIYIRSGGLCNPGGIATYLGLSPWEMRRAYSSGHRCGYATEIVSGKPTGVVRVSIGAMNTIQDVDNFLDLLQNHFLALCPGNVTPARAFVERRKLDASSRGFGDLSDGASSERESANNA